MGPGLRVSESERDCECKCERECECECERASAPCAAGAGGGHDRPRWIACRPPAPVRARHAQGPGEPRNGPRHFPRTSIPAFALRKTQEPTHTQANNEGRGRSTSESPGAGHDSLETRPAAGEPFCAFCALCVLWPPWAMGRPPAARSRAPPCLGRARNLPLLWAVARGPWPAAQTPRRPAVASVGQAAAKQRPAAGRRYEWE